ncbi:hypothetical protein QJS10_CPA06g02551 [Acorus calamus]|uniref:DUF7642 domain-containing protein n=1 Tax=Acorus calamus TaxID=4465 RepID=A0AAV9ERH7_ACOCL|nr:hypothetical protein QJS10_CPA06g02551 [Acorus calamus]
MEENYIRYQMSRWILYSLLLILAWGIGLFMLLYIPVRRHVIRRDFRTRQLYVTPDSIVYKVTRPVPFPCFGALKKKKYVLLHSVADIVVEQGYLQSLFGIYSIRIEYAGLTRPASDDVKIQGIADPRAFRKAVLMHIGRMKMESFNRQVSNSDLSSFGPGNPPSSWFSPSRSLRNDSIPPGQLILQKLEEVSSSVKRVQTLMEEQHCQTSEP